jgi:triosephosphate isomerase
MGRKPLMAGNWKMNKTNNEAVELIRSLAAIVNSNVSEALVCPPFSSLQAVSEVIKNEGSSIKLGAQNMHWEDSGAYTGEISPDMLKALNVDYVIIGHSERRQYFCETDETVNKKVKAALAKNLTPIIAVGETLEEREQGKTQSKIKNQVTKALEGISDLGPTVFAYEPIWAIGTGKTATPEQANDVIRFIRALIGIHSTPEIAQKVRILYGGSVSPDNVDELMEEPDIDGALVGGASLNPDSFARIINFRA